jgi:leader peptidase (prepilin peptidase)/N-methyltransferase
VPQPFFEYWLTACAFIFGAVVGSFLNVCIYRLPLNLSVNEPRRSFCPHCKTQIPWRENLPLISWLVLRGKCARCSAPIPFRYFAVELLTACAFLAVWLRFNLTEWERVLPYWLLISLLIVATFIDLEHFIIPDEITIGGTVAGVLCSLAVPSLMNTESHLASAALSLLGAGAGFVTLWIVVELGKKAFGRKRHKFDPEAPFHWVRHGDDADLTVAEDKLQWSELFARDSDQLIVTCKDLQIDGSPAAAERVTFHYDRILLPDRELKLDTLDTISATVSEIVIPREAMGFGDVKFIAAIGAFLGWKAVFFTIMSASAIGAVIGVLGILLGKRDASAKIPFGPYLALGAILWMFAGESIVAWYLTFARGPAM